jgi:hypothetical protein
MKNAAVAIAAAWLWLLHLVRGSSDWWWPLSGPFDDFYGDDNDDDSGGQVPGAIPSPELNALQALFDATNGASWDWGPVLVDGPEWDFADPDPAPCAEGDEWQGLTCACGVGGSNCTVTELVLSGYDLDGYLPAAIGNLTNCIRLNLVANRKLSGTIPSLDHLTQLRDLYLESNALTGSIPSLDKLSQIQLFDLDTNSLTGSIPSLDNLIQLQQLFLEINALTGSIPSFDNMTQLQALDFGTNVLTGSIPSLDSLAQLQYLWVSNNCLEGSVPPSVGSLHALVSRQL